MLTASRRFLPLSITEKTGAYFRWRGLLSSFFTFAGVFKSDINLPFDLTLFLGILVFLSYLREIYSLETLPKTIILMAFIWGSLLHSVANAEGFHSIDKTIRFYTLTFLAGFASIILFRKLVDVRKLFWSFIIVGFIICFSAISNFRDLGKFDHLQAFDANTINLGRAVGLALVFILILLLNDKVTSQFGALAIIPIIFVILSFSSQGPLLAVIVAVLPLIFIRIKKTAIILRLVALIVLLASFSVVILPLVPSQSILRITDLISGSED